MKVLFLGAYNDSDVVIAPIKVGRELFKNISDKGINSVFLCYFDDGSKYTRFQKLFGFEKIKDRIFRTGIFPLILFTLKFKPVIIQIVTPEAFYLPIFFLKIILNVKIIYLTHSIISYSLKNYINASCYQKFRLRMIEKTAYKFSDMILTLSNTDARFIRIYLKVNPGKIKVVNNGINLYELKKNYKDDDELKKIISVGSLNRKEKSFDFLFNGLASLNNYFELTICNYKAQSSKGIKVSENIKLIWHPPLNEYELRKEICKNDLFLITSRHESFSLSLLEAMDTGILFITSDRVGITERFPESFKKFIIPFGNTKELKNKILELQNLSSDEKNKLSDVIKKFASGFKWNKISENYLQLYNGIILKN